MPLPSVPDNYAEQLRAARKRLRLTQEQLADRLGVSLASINRWENGHWRPGRATWRHITTNVAILGPVGTIKSIGQIAGELTIAADRLLSQSAAMKEWSERFYALAESLKLLTRDDE